MKKTTLLAAAVLPLFMTGCSSVEDLKNSLSNLDLTAPASKKAAASSPSVWNPSKVTKTATKTMTPVAPTNTEASKADTAIAKAVADNKAVKVAGFHWKVTPKLIKQAKAAAKDGNFAKAIKLANKASRYAAKGFEQAETSKTAGPRF
jgi:hypothetical protein